MPLTDTACRQAKPQEKPQKLADGGGLYLLVNQKGKYWRWDYRFEGKRKTMALGVYPDVPLAAARQAHKDARQALAAGNDPMAERKAKKTDSTFEDIARQWYAHWSPSKSDSHAAYALRRLESDVFPAIGRKRMSDLAAADFRDMAKKIESRGALEIAKRSLQTCGQIMRYAVAHGLAERNPVSDIRPSDVLKTQKKRNYPRIDAKELPKLLREIDNYVGGVHTRLALSLMVLTFVRTSELIEASWDEFDLDGARWNIPAERMKMQTPHIVPLSRQALTVLKDIKAESYGNTLLFPGERNPKKPISNNTMLFALYRMGYKGRMTGHGFRGVASTILHEQGYQHEHIELQLAHAERDAVSAAYNHALYLPQRRKMMQDWADYLDKIRVSADILPIKAA